MTYIDNIKKHQQAFLNTAKARKEQVVFVIEGIEFVVNPNVFPPATDTKLLVAHIHCKKGDKILDLTTGSGVVAIAAGLQGAHGLAVDINPSAIENATQNFRKHHVNIHAIQSNLFDRVPYQRFDQIYANGPYIEGDITDPMDYACYGARLFIEEVCSGLHKYLKKNGKLLIVMAAWSDLEHFHKTVKKNRLRATLLATRISDDGERTYNLYEVKKTR